MNAYFMNQKPLEYILFNLGGHAYIVVYIINLHNILSLVCRFVGLHGDKIYIIYFCLWKHHVKFIIAKLSIRKPGSTSVLIICDLFNNILCSNKFYVVFPQTKLL